MTAKNKDFYIYLSTFFMLIVLIIPANIAAQCPTISNTNQSFCDLDDPTIADLIATDSGNGIQWYDTPSSTTPISSTIGLLDGEDYYADDNSGSCGVRERVDVTIYGAPFGLNFQGVCVDDPNDATIADLTAIGNNVQWYNVASGGIPLLSSTVLNDNTIYYADQENPDTGCRTSRLSVLVVIGVVPVPTGNPVQIFCSETPPTVGDLTATNADSWYATNTSVIPLDPSTLLIDGENYFATSVDPPCESNDRFEVTVIIDDPADPGTSGSLDICESEISTIISIDLFDELSGTPDTNGSWSGPLPTTNGSTGTLDITSMTVSGSPYTFTYTIDPGNSCSPTSSTVTITISPEPNAGTSGSIDICNNDATQDLFDVLGGSPDTGGTWSPALDSGTGLFDPNVDAPGTYTYTVTGTAPCPDASATVTVAVVPEPNAGTSGSIDICNNDATQDLFDVLGGSPDTGGTWSPTLASGTGLFDPNVDAPGTYTYTVTGTAPCPDASATVTVAVVPEPNAGNDVSVVICSEDGIQNLFDFITGNPDTGGIWSPPLASGTGFFDPNLDTPGVYSYSVGPNQCNQRDLSEITVTIETNPDVTGLELQVGNICLGLPNLVEIIGATSLPDGDYTIVYSLTNANNFQNSVTVTFTGGNSDFSIPDSFLTNIGTTTIAIISLIPMNSMCSADVTLITSADFIVFDNVTPEIIEEGNIFCEQDEPTISDLTASIVGNAPITWYDDPNGGTIYSDTTLLEDGETYYASTLTAEGCESIPRLEVTVQLDDCPNDIIIPDGFSPNGDNINDDFNIVNLRDLYPNFTLEVYNRYGNILYKGNIDTPNWNGNSEKGITLGNSELPVGVYFYILKFNDGNRKPIQGRVYLSR
ncbi:gliding motility-associated C-terminal domain-containing protein [Hanstruepera ponticola]|uniref:gliding motility-associated C-terminal domain-containing protein n=1 Tax=Hanstruepera ponticola TaxID=2042995 RepID=UPI000CF0D410|nr:gliding motility-associated C-terminal domain-containing protein [Hanstruepera ponticola]